MRTLLAFAPLLFGSLLHAQPGDLDLWNSPCPGSSYDLFPLDPARPDFRVIMRSEGTDDVPSSSGTCLLEVMAMPHVDLLYADDGHGNLELVDPEQGIELHPDSLALALAQLRLRWLPGGSSIAHRGYGKAFAGPNWTAVDQRGYTQAIARVRTPQGTWLCLVRATTNAAEGLASFHALAKAREGTLLHWP